MATPMAAEEKGSAAVYASWATFKNALEGFVQGIPNQIDRSVFPGLAWSVQSQVLAGLKFLGLIDDKGKPTQALQKLAVPDEDLRKEALKTVLNYRYADLIALDLTKTTPAQLDDQIAKSYSVTGETREKAVRFFLSAADYAGIPLSSYLKPKASAGAPVPGASRKRRTGPRPKAPIIPQSQELQPPSPTTGTVRVVNLKSGGTLTVTASIDVLRLAPADRTFVFDLIDKLEEYERDNAPEETSAPIDEEGQEE